MVLNLTFYVHKWLFPIFYFYLYYSNLGEIGENSFKSGKFEHCSNNFFKNAISLVFLIDRTVSYKKELNCKTFNSILFQTDNLKPNLFSTFSFLSLSLLTHSVMSSLERRFAKSAKSYGVFYYLLSICNYTKCYTQSLQEMVLTRGKSL